jgi:hypothetical protein
MNTMRRKHLTVTKVRLFVASPGDVSAERDHLAKVIGELNATVGAYKGLTVELVRWETHCTPAMGRPQGVVNAQIGAYDVFVGIMWRRFGTPTGAAESGTEEEFRIAYDCWLRNSSVHILFYFSQKPFMPRKDDEVEHLGKVLSFRRELEQKGLVWEYRDSDDFPNVVRPHLSRILLDMASGRGARKEPRRRKRPRVFIGCSAIDLPLAKRLVQLLDDIGLEGVLWSDQFKVGRNILELWEDLPSKVDAAIFFFGSNLANGVVKYPRENVVFELGLFHGKLGRQKTIILASGAVNLPTDILGTIYLRYEPERPRVVTEQLRREFKNMGLL